jgi:hypothetical protein
VQVAVATEEVGLSSHGRAWGPAIPKAGALNELAEHDEGGGEEEVEIDDGLELLGAASELAVAVHPAVGALKHPVTVPLRR